MSGFQKGRSDLYAIIAVAIVFINAFITYLLTMSPDLPFWDCGEFIACAHTMGVPHPPGTPLFILLGKMFLLFNVFYENLAARMNFFSVISSALSVALTCMIIIKIVKMWFGEKANEMPYNLLAYLGGITGALYHTYSTTFWFSAVEAEVYGTAMLVMQIIVYLTLIWYTRRGKPGSWKYLLMITYLSFLSIAIHMTVFLVMPAVFLFIIYSDKKLRTDWRVWALGVTLLLTAVDFNYFLIASVVFLVIGVIFIASAKKCGVWSMVLSAVLLAVLGFSVHIYIPISSMNDPYIDMNNPETIDSFNYFMGRKQYGQESMLSSMFNRKGSWENQFGDFHRMGFWHFFKKQYSSPILLFLPLLIGLFGVFEALRRDMKPGGLLALLLLICTIGLVIYMNFSDGTRGVRLEVRDRDYFFTPGFMYFALFIGLGVSGIGAWMSEKLLVSRAGKSASLIPALIMILISIGHTAPSHWKYQDRSGVHLPADYAFNILNSCEKDGIIFTNGDNDTYPLWYLQLVEGIRTDVRVVNLSLINTDWYIMQQKNQFDVPIPLTDEQVKWNFYEDAAGNMLMKPSKAFKDPITGQLKYLTPNQINVQHEIVRMITISNNWKYPVYLAATVGKDIQNLMGEYLERHGMAYKIVPEKIGGKYNPAVTDSLLNQVYRYRGIDDPEIHFGDTELAMTITYPEMYINLSDQLLAEGDTTWAKELLEDAVETFPFYYRAPMKLRSLLIAQKNLEEAETVINGAIDRVKSMVDRYPEDILWHLFMGPLYMETGNLQEAIEQFETALEINPDEKMVLGSILNAYQLAGENEKGRKLLDRWREKYPRDPSIQQLYSRYSRMFR
ncbi:MAG: DUF2723 domain-containing protein [candidate division Zixibacteria bacterium]|nr:DUF2723 domain-containing protein [candidate division Zixibacteria bacterium]